MDIEIWINDVKYVRADTLRGASVQLLASIQENEKLMEDNTKLMEEMAGVMTDVTTARAAAWAWKETHDKISAELKVHKL